jgi:uncharacterized protein YecE (DUF72 family)
MIARDVVERVAAAVPPLVRFGASSWNYPGWRGLVYHETYKGRGASTRMLEEYARFPLFRTVGIDASFYAAPTPELLHGWAERLPPGFPGVSKVWQQLTVHTWTSAQNPAKAGKENPDFLNADLFLESVAAPCIAHFADHLGPLIFEFQQIPRSTGVGPQQFADGLDRFFARLPRELRYAVEVRNEEFLTPAYFAVLREHDVGHVFNSGAGCRRSARSSPSPARSPPPSSWPAPCSAPAGATTRQWMRSRRTTGSSTPTPGCAPTWCAWPSSRSPRTFRRTSWSTTGSKAAPRSPF